MFVDAIEVVGRFTKPIYSIGRYYGSTAVHPGSATLFFVNADGWALTCRHVAVGLLASDELRLRRDGYRRELVEQSGKAKRKQLERELARKYGFTNTGAFELYHTFIGCIDGDLQCDIKSHPVFDLALLHFKGGRILCDTFPTFARDGSGLKQGKFLCRLGYPFPEFTNYAYNAETDEIGWTQEGNQRAPRFPIEGMVTRHLAGEAGKVVGFEMSTPGLCGQSGGPAFDASGVVWGMQSATNHLDLDFDVDQEVLRQGKAKHVRDSAFLHVGHCVHVDELKAFMRDNAVTFNEG